MSRFMAVNLLLASAVVGAAAFPAQAAAQQGQGGAAFTNSAEPVVPGAVRAYPGTAVPAGAVVRANDLPPVLQAQFATLTASPAPATVGSKITISGTLTGLTNSGWVPLPGQTVTFTATADPTEAIASATTDAGGAFSTTATVTGPVGSPYEVHASWTDPQNGVQANSWLTVSTPVLGSLSDFTVSYSPYGDITAQASIAETDHTTPSGSVDLQYSANGSTGWKTIKAIAWNGNASFNTTFFYGQSGYWRAFYPGDSGHLAATSPVRKAWRWSTYMSKISASAHQVSPHGRLTIAGTLYRYTSIGHKSAYRNESVEVIFRFKGKKTWYRFGWAKTNSNGHFSFTGHVYGSATYLVIFPGGSDTFACQSPNSVTVTT